VGKIPFFMHDLGQTELDGVAEVLRGPMLTTGDTVAEFERLFAEKLGVKHAIATTSCTGALHISLVALGIGPGDEVITTPMTFIATALAIEHAGATPVFVDVEPDTGNLDVRQVEQAITDRTRAIIPVHLYGQLCDMHALRSLADKYHLAIVEDAAHCIEGRRAGVGPGQLGETACFSFYATKNITCGEGGAVVTNDDALARKLKLLRLHGMSHTAADRAKHNYKHWDLPMLGWKYNMDNIQAAMLLPQLRRLDANLAKRHALASRYDSLLHGLPGIEVPALRPETVHARHLYPILTLPHHRDRLVQYLIDREIGVVVNYRAIHLLTYFRDKFGYAEGTFPTAESWGSRVISLPFYPSMKQESVDAVADTVSTFASQLRKSA